LLSDPRALMPPRLAFVAAALLGWPVGSMVALAPSLAGLGDLRPAPGPGHRSGVRERVRWRPAPSADSCRKDLNFFSTVAPA